MLQDVQTGVVSVGLQQGVRATINHGDGPDLQREGASACGRDLEHHVRSGGWQRRAMFLDLQ
jgi:hypothetical protein